MVRLGVLFPALLLCATATQAADAVKIRLSGNVIFELPYQLGGIEDESSIRGAEFQVVNCIRAGTVEGENGARLTAHRKDRQLKIVVPPRVDLDRMGTVNRILADGLTAAWKICPAYFDTLYAAMPDYSGVQATIEQDGKTAMNAGATAIAQDGQTVRISYLNRVKPQPEPETHVTQQNTTQKTEATFSDSNGAVSIMAGGQYPIRLPWPNGGVGSSSDIRGTTFSMSKCDRNKAGIIAETIYDAMGAQRTVSANVPTAINLMNARNANTVLVQSLHYAFANCPYTGRYKEHTYGHVAVNVFQDGVLAIKTHRNSPPNDDGMIRFQDVEHVLADKIAEREREEAAAIAAAKRQESWNAATSTISDIFKLILVIVSGVALFRYGPVAFTRVRWFFFPHPAVSHVERSTRGELSQPLDGSALADALAFEPRNETEAKLARLDIARANQRLREERDYLLERENLAKLAIETEKARVRVEEMERRRRAS